MTKRQQTNIMRGLHNWSYEEFIVCYYITKHGLTNIRFRTVGSVCEYLGVPFHSFKMMESNFRHLLGFKTHILTHIKPKQREVFECLKGEPMYEVYRLVKDIIEQDRVERENLLRLCGKENKRLVMVS